MVTIDEIRRCLEEGDYAAAVRLARQWPRRSTDPKILQSWAEVLEQVGLIDEAIEAWTTLGNLIDDPDPWERLAEIYLDQGSIPQAIDTLQKAVARRTERLETYITLGELFEDEEKFDRARDIYQIGWERLEHPLLKTRLDNLPAQPRTIKTDLGIEPTEPDLIHMLQYFRGRDGVYARQWVDRKGQTGYHPVHEPLTPEVLRRHLRGDVTIGVYPVRLDNTVYFIAWDIDINKSVLKKYRKDNIKLRKLAQATHQAAVRIHAWLEAHGIPSIIEDSGYKGRHVWVFLARPVEARIAREIARRVAGLHPLPEELHYEIFPRQDALEPDQLGNLIKLPLGIHRRTGRRCLFLKPDGGAYPDPLKALFDTPRVSPDLLIDKVRGLGMLATFEIKEGEPVDEETRSIQVAQLPPYHPESDPEFMTLMTFCPTLRALVDKAYKKGYLEYDEQLVIVHTLGHLTHGVDAVNTILRQCVNASERLFLKSPLRGNPMSCPKIHRRVPEITRQFPCECPQVPELGYPTPLLFLKIKETYDPDVWQSMEIARLAEAYLNIHEQLKALEHQFNQVASQLRTWFERTGDYVHRVGDYELRYDPESEAIQVTPSHPETEATS